MNSSQRTAVAWALAVAALLLAGCRNEGVRTDPHLVALLVEQSATTTDPLLRDLMLLGAMVQSDEPHLELLGRMKHPFARDVGVVSAFMDAVHGSDAAHTDAAIDALTKSDVRGLVSFVLLSDASVLAALSPAQTERLRSAIASAGNTPGLRTVQEAAIVFALGDQSAALALQEAQKLSDPFARLLLFAVNADAAAAEDPDVVEDACRTAPSAAWRDMGWMSLADTIAGDDWPRARRAADRVHNPVLRALALGELAGKMDHLERAWAYVRELRPPVAGAVGAYHAFEHAAAEDLASANEQAEKLTDFGLRALAWAAIARQVAEVDGPAARKVLDGAISSADRSQDAAIAALAFTRAGETAFLLDDAQSLALWSQAQEKLTQVTDPAARGVCAAWLAQSLLASDVAAAAEVVRSLPDADTRALLALSLLDRAHKWQEPVGEDDLDYEVTVQVQQTHAGKRVADVGIVVTDATAVDELSDGRPAGEGKVWAVLEVAFGNEGKQTVDLSRWQFRLLHTGGQWAPVLDRRPAALSLPPGDRVLTQELAFPIPLGTEAWCLEALAPGAARVLLPPRPVVASVP